MLVLLAPGSCGSLLDTVFDQPDFGDREQGFLSGMVLLA